MANTYATIDEFDAVANFYEVAATFPPLLADTAAFFYTAFFLLAFDCEKRKNTAWLDDEDMGDTQSHNNDDILTNTIFRKGLVIQLDSVSLERNKVLWRHCLVGYLLDERRFSIRRMQSILNSAWRLRGSIRIVGRQESYYIIHFEYPTDQEYILCEGPWFVDGALLVVEQWTPNLALNQIQLTFFTTWVQVHNLPLEYHDTDLAHFMGDLIGEYVSMDWQPTFLETSAF
nr:hypothetical protein CFP56_26613 [Quercus suber]